MEPFEPIYTIEVRSKSDHGPGARVVAKVRDSELGELFKEMGVDQDRWNLWHKSVSTGKPFDVMPEFPRLSSLAHADEGTIRFKGDEVGELGDECIGALARVQGESARSVISRLQEAGSLALAEGGEVAVHPFGD